MFFFDYHKQKGKLISTRDYSKQRKSVHVVASSLSASERAGHEATTSETTSRTSFFLFAIRLESIYPKRERENIGTCKKRRERSLCSPPRASKFLPYFCTLCTHRAAHNSTVSNNFFCIHPRKVHKRREHEWCRKQQQQIYIVCYAQHTFFNATSEYSRIIFSQKVSSKKLFFWCHQRTWFSKALRVFEIHKRRKDVSILAYLASIPVAQAERLVWIIYVHDLAIFEESCQDKLENREFPL